jgi:signal transduction histidine kinase
MRTSFYRRPLTRRFLPIVLATAGLGGMDSARAAGGQKRVLVVYSVRRDAQIAIIGDRELPRALEHGLSAPVDFYSEYLDNARFPRPEHREAMRDFMRHKYAGQRFDVIIALSSIAVQFVVENRRDLFPDTPVVFVDTTEPPNMPDATGLIADLNLRGTLDLARQLQPDLRNVFLVAGAGPNDLVYEEIARRQLHSLESQLTTTYLSGLATNELEERLATLPARSMVFYLMVSRDGTGELVHPLEYLERVAAIANAPTYSWVDSAIGHGIVGGSLKSQTDEIAVLAKLALRVLQGEPAHRITPAISDLSVAQIDWRQLRRWGISETGLPTNAVIRFREPSIWNRYRGYFLAVVGLVTVQSGLIALLLVQRARRRQAEAEVRAGQAKLRVSYERIRDLGGRLLMAQEAERSRIARELHDDVGQQLSLLAIHLELIGGAGRDLEAVTGSPLQETLHRTRDIAKCVHDLSHRLHPERVHLLGLVAALRGIQREFSVPNLALTFAHRDVPDSLPHHVTLCLFRIVQEALQNVVKHSAAHEVSIELNGVDAGLKLTITDDGSGFDRDTAKDNGIGLISMVERLDAIGGSLVLSTRPGAGTRLEITVPHERLALVSA